MTMEQRAVAAPPEVREDNGGKIARGYAALFNSEADIGGRFREIIAPGAFTETLKNGDIRALIEHDTGRVIGRSSAGTLRLKEDDKGLSVEIDLPDTTDGRDLAVSLERGDISGMSFSFVVRHDEWDETSDPPTRTIHAVDLREVSTAAFPAYDDTEIALRSLEDARSEKRKKNWNNSGYLIRKAQLDHRERRI